MQALNDDERTERVSIDNALSMSNRKLDRKVKRKLALRVQQARKRILPRLEDYNLIRLLVELQQLLADHGVDGSCVHISPTPPTVTRMIGCDLSMNVSELARVIDRPANNVAGQLANVLCCHPTVSEARAAGSFVNIFLDYKIFALAILEQIQALNDHFGHANAGKGEIVIVDYSSPNVAKNMTVAHLRSTNIGQAIANLLDAHGYTTFRLNHLGDWGTQFGKLLWEYQKELTSRGEAFLRDLAKAPVDTLMTLYREFIKREKADPAALNEARMLFLNLETGKPELISLWTEFRKWTLAEFQPIYDRLDIRFDAVQGESFYEDRMMGAVEEALIKGVLELRVNGSVVYPGQTIIDPATGKENDKLMKTTETQASADEDWKDEVIRKPNGGTVYLTRDIAALRYRSCELGAGKILYVIGKEQQRHCAILFSIGRQTGWLGGCQAQHVSFGHLNVDGRKMKSRAGKVVLLKDVLDETEAAASDLFRIRKGKSDLTAEETIAATKVAIGTVIFNDLKQDRERDIEFSPDAARSLAVGTCPYIQYTYCRLHSISAKVGAEQSPVAVPELSRIEKSICLLLAMFPVTVDEAVQSNSPHRIATYLNELAQLANRFYETHEVSHSEGDTRAFRSALIEATLQVLTNATALLNIPLPDRM